MTVDRLSSPVDRDRYMDFRDRSPTVRTGNRPTSTLVQRSAHMTGHLERLDSIPRDGRSSRLGFVSNLTPTSGARRAHHRPVNGTTGAYRTDNIFPNEDVDTVPNKVQTVIDRLTASPYQKAQEIGGHLNDLFQLKSNERVSYTVFVQDVFELMEMIADTFMDKNINLDEFEAALGSLLHILASPLPFQGSATRVEAWRLWLSRRACNNLTGSKAKELNEYLKSLYLQSRAGQGLEDTDLPPDLVRNAFRARG